MKICYFANNRRDGQQCGKPATHEVVTGFEGDYGFVELEREAACALHAKGIAGLNRTMVRRGDLRVERLAR
jgi:hypothetical protein